MSDSTHKVVVVGSGGVGKSCITVRFVQGKFIKRYDPTIEDFYRKQLDVDGEAVMLDILDTAGQEEFSSLRDSYMKTGNGFIIVFAVNSASSFDETKKLREQALRIKEKDQVPMVLVGNKCDIEDREVQREEAEKLAEEWKCQYIETSAKDNINIAQVFEDVVKAIRQQEQANGSKTAKKRMCMTH
ncbi:Ras-related protein Rap-1b [Spironucleus salmonicida]|uniref:Ras-related protein Rap-1b n=1 Tax=Spironucleus salmonicida TaxID=348837 RepID=V6LRL4_9EUKA|nr:Ras-related protein Rap-1b [Spironucleus salmonicida]|eukprot:EST46336.1 Ras-related protein Rap-1b [Spironucleus salmonicida]